MLMNLDVLTKEITNGLKNLKKKITNTLKQSFNEYFQKTFV